MEQQEDLINDANNVENHELTIDELTKNKDKEIQEALHKFLGKRLKFDYNESYVFEGALFSWGSYKASDEEINFPEHFKRTCPCSPTNQNERFLTFYNVYIYRKDDINNKVNISCCKIPETLVENIPEHVEYN